MNAYLNYEEQVRFRLYSNLDKEQNQFSMTFVHSTEKSQIATKIIPVNINQMSTIDMIDSHKKTRNIISNRSLWVIVEIKRLKSSNLRIENQIKKERSLNREKYVRL